MYMMSRTTTHCTYSRSYCTQRSPVRPTAVEMERPTPGCTSSAHPPLSVRKPERSNYFLQFNGRISFPLIDLCNPMHAACCNCTKKGRQIKRTVYLCDALEATAHGLVGSDWVVWCWMQDPLPRASLSGDKGCAGLVDAY